MKIDREALRRIKEQYNKISQIKYADSWGADFHKGIGGCPVSSSIIMLNNVEDLNLLSKKEGSSLNLHQIAEEFSFNNPADFTLETSRPGGAAIAALISLHTLGTEGYQRNLANLIEGCLETRKRIRKYKDIKVINSYSKGYVTMIRIYPPKLENKSIKKEITDSSREIKEFIERVNDYSKQFFNWDTKTRISKNKGVEYSFSNNYLNTPSGTKISALKFYPVSPHFNKKIARESIKILVKQKKIFDKSIWKK